MISTHEERAELRRLALKVMECRQRLERSDGTNFAPAANAFDNAAAELHAKLSPERVRGLIDAHEQDLERLAFVTAQATRVYEHFAPGIEHVTAYADDVIRIGDQRHRDLTVQAVQEALGDAAAQTAG